MTSGTPQGNNDSDRSAQVGETGDEATPKHLQGPVHAQGARFAVDESLWCVWDWNLSEINRDFLDSFDPGYFDYLVELHGRALSDNQTAQHAAVALRTSYSHAMETLFAMIGAVLQAPECVVGWLHKYRNQELENLVYKLHHRQPVLTKLPLRDMSWQGLANAVFSYISLPDKVKEDQIKREYGRLWSILAEDFLNPQTSAEYNGFKHGMRLRSGGFYLSAGVEKAPGTPCPPEKMKSLGGSRFGSSFYVPERFDGVDSRNIHMVHHSQNWVPERFICRIQLIAMSLRNLLSFVKIVLGADVTQQQFVWPDNLEVFADCWRASPGVMGASFNQIITKDDIAPQSRDQILSVYQRREHPQDQSTQHDAE